MHLLRWLTLLLLITCSPVAWSMDISGDWARTNAIAGNYRIDYSRQHAWAVQGLCYNLLKLRNFEGFDHCIGQWSEHFISPEGYYIAKHAMGETILSKDFADALLYGMQAQAALERSDLELARELGLKALAGVRGQPTQMSGMFKKKPSRGSIKVYKPQVAPRVLGTLAVVEGTSGNRDQALAYVRELEDLKVKCFGCSGNEPFKRAWLTRGYLAVQDYEAAFESITGEQAKGAKLLESAFYQLNPAYYLVAAVTGFTKGKMDDFQNMEAAAMLCHTIDRLGADGAADCWDRLLDERFIDVFGAMKLLALSRLGRLRHLAGDDEAALPLLIEAIDLLEEQRSSLALDTNKMGFVSDKLAPYRDAIAIHVRQRKYDKALAFAERAKSRALVDLLASRGRIDPRVPALENDLVELEAAEDMLATIDLSGSGRPGASRGILLEKRNKIARTAPEFASLRTVKTPELAELQARLAPGEAILEYYGYQDDYFVFVMTRHGVVGTSIEGGPLTAKIDAFRTTLMNPEDNAYREQGLGLYADLVQPISGYLEDVSSLTIVPHGPLHYLPFAALTDGRTYLVDRFELRVLPSASVLAFVGVEGGGNDSTLILGNPDLGNPALDLPGAQAEAQAIAARRSPARLYLRKQASESLIKQAGADYGFLHLASHGVFDPDDPLGSGLLLAPDVANDGMLTVAELFDLELNADLVTLSACETALGEITSGDDLVGFTRGFLYAGTDSIVSSLWQVSDEATRILMQAFYDELAASTKRASLRQAQLLLKDTEYSHPYYWAAFQLTGAI